MILDELTLHNFYAFRGSHEIALTPPSARKPIVLFGGLNGAGKTSILEAVQLALYGRLAKGLRQNGHSYAEYLRASITHGVPAQDGAAVSLSFRSVADGKEQNYRVRRSWSIPRERVAEHLDVFVDGKRDELLSDSWAEHVDRFIPSRLADLYLFDGERIESLADPDQSSRFIRTAVHALLGVDLAQQLHTDLSVLRRRKLKETTSGTERDKIQELESRVEALGGALVDLKQQNANLRNQRDRAAKVQRERDHEFREAGGTLLESRKELEAERDRLTGVLQGAREGLVSVAHEALPFLLVPKLLSAALKQATAEDTSRSNRSLLGVLKERDRELLAHLKDVGDPDAVKRAEAFLTRDAKSRSETLLDDEYLGLSHEDELHASAILADGHDIGGLPKARELVARADQLENELEQVERKLAAIPDNDAVAVLLTKRDEARRATLELAHQLESHDRQVIELENKTQTASDELDRVLRSNRHVQLENEDTERVLRHAERAQSTLKRFQKAVVRKNVEKLQGLILEGFQRLIRKQSMIAGIRIDPDDCSLLVLGKDGRRLDPQRFSAGERQLLAVSVLWGLGRASGRPLPVIIDTPLGRLDSTHRENLVERYFPHASHQVLLLSTDEEIDREHHERLRSQVGHSYRIEHNEDENTSCVTRGYFW